MSLSARHRRSHLVALRGEHLDVELARVRPVALAALLRGDVLAEWDMVASNPRRDERPEFRVPDLAGAPQVDDRPKGELAAGLRRLVLAHSLW